LSVLLVIKIENSSSKPNDDEHYGNHPDCNSIDLAPDCRLEDLCFLGNGLLVNNRGKRW
jgi:hypothetical protein